MPHEPTNVTRAHAAKEARKRARHVLGQMQDAYSTLHRATLETASIIVQWPALGQHFYQHAFDHSVDSIAEDIELLERAVADDRIWHDGPLQPPRDMTPEEEIEETLHGA